jgi:hypothetical protein
VSLQDIPVRAVTAAGAARLPSFPADDHARPECCEEKFYITLKLF